MPSTYNNALRLEMIGTGEQAGLWGDTTNNNLGTLLVDAVAGYTSVSITSSSQALTVIDGLEDQSRNAMIALTTTTTANFSVFIPPSSKAYIFYNASAYTATIYNSTSAGNTTIAGTGVAIPAGKVMAVWSEGTNVAQQNTHLNSPSFTTPDLGTPSAATLTNATGLPISTGVSGLGSGVATFLATPSSANLAAAVTGETGSGALVFATSPTLVTPALGTPSSATLTNATGLPIDGGTTGTLPASRGGTGVTSSTGSGSVVLSNSPTLVSPALGTPASGNFSSGTFTWPTFNQNTSGNAATATAPAGGGSFITSSNIGSQSVNYANYSGYTTGNAATATNPASGGSFITSSNIGSQSVNYANYSGYTTGNAATATNVAWSGVTSKPTLLYRAFSGSVTGSINSSGAAATDVLTISPVTGALGPLELAFDYWTYWGSSSNPGEFWVTSYVRGKTAISGGTNYITANVYHIANGGPHILTGYVWQGA